MADNGKDLVPVTVSEGDHSCLECVNQIGMSPSELQQHYDECNKQFNSNNEELQLSSTEVLDKGSEMLELITNQNAKEYFEDSMHDFKALTKQMEIKKKEFEDLSAKNLDLEKKLIDYKEMENVAAETGKKVQDYKHRNVKLTKHVLDQKYDLEKVQKNLSTCLYDLKTTSERGSSRNEKIVSTRNTISELEKVISTLVKEKEVLQQKVASSEQRRKGVVQVSFIIACKIEDCHMIP